MVRNAGVACLVGQDADGTQPGYNWGVSHLGMPVGRTAAVVIEGGETVRTQEGGGIAGDADRGVPGCSRAAEGNGVQVSRAHPHSDIFVAAEVHREQGGAYGAVPAGIASRNAARQNALVGRRDVGSVGGRASGNGGHLPIAVGHKGGEVDRSTPTGGGIRTDGEGRRINDAGDHGTCC